MDIENKSIIELKALAYDILLRIQLEQQKLSLINQQIQKKQEIETVENK